MLKINSPIARESLAIDPETGKPIVVKLDPPGLMIGLRTKQSKTTYMISILDVYMAAKQSKGDDFKAIGYKPKIVKPQEPRPSELIKEVLEHNDKLHFSQIRQQLHKKGVELSKSVVGDLLTMMREKHEIEHDERMYYFLTHKAQ